jgi:hypothetical protein
MRAKLSIMMAYWRYVCLPCGIGVPKPATRDYSDLHTRLCKLTSVFFFFYYSLLTTCIMAEIQAPAEQSPGKLMNNNPYTTLVPL